MSVPLKDFRLALPESTLAALEAEGVAFDKDMRDVAREILQEWQRRRHHAYKVYARRCIANGLQVELPGLELVDDGISRKAGK